MKKPRCGKCKKPVDQVGSHCVMPIDGPTIWYHWDCFSPEYNAKVDRILETSSKSN